MPTHDIDVEILVIRLSVCLSVCLCVCMSKLLYVYIIRLVHHVMDLSFWCSVLNHRRYSLAVVTHQQTRQIQTVVCLCQYQISSLLLETQQDTGRSVPRLNDRKSADCCDI